ncbi:RNA 2',3'-cyclic phosphodiesterase [Metabacillus schmidteae]|uniref:RNA 2',3'-cyclic phosphodiesterase n=1 Tax=Metabacillus schmidteae TaxID=2730405 RepID=UPI00158A4150|nr:RNA 2',3'-cyclic phosphodiesterase [Metabacillus schmidteae]
MKKHYFLAVPIEEKQREILQNWIQINKTTLPFKSWVHPEDYHITLAFLGDVQPSTRLNDLTKKVNEIIKSCEHFEMSLKGIDIFGRKDSPRIFWASVEHSSSLNYLQTQIVKACDSAGFELDRKPFRPHITLARKWNSVEPFIKSPGLEHVFTDNRSPSMVTSVHLYQTNLDQIPKYEAINSFSLLQN